MKNDEMAKRILLKAIRRIKERFLPLGYGIDIFVLTESDENLGHMATDGERLFYSPDTVVRTYRSGRTDILEYEIMHLSLHGILGHFFEAGQYTATKLAWRIMDRQVEQILEDLDMLNPEKCFCPEWFETVGMGLYHQAFKDKSLRCRTLREGALHTIDDHSFWWYRNRGKNQNKDSSVNGVPTTGDGSSSNADMVADKWEKAKEYLLGGENLRDKSTEKDITEILKNAKPGQGHGTETNSESLCSTAAGERFSFSEVFRDFLSSRTISRDQPDYIDNMIYQYGLEMYGDVPLVEPMEEIEEPKLGNMIIAIDTSGSCIDYMGIFLKQLVGIFRDVSAKYKFEKIYLIQCDSSIKNVCEFSDVNELEEVDDHMRVYGFGGTDFRPVFSWITKNILDIGDEVDCLLYFSDTEGCFPLKESDYPTFFIAPTKDFLNNMDIPSWVRKVYLNGKNTTDAIMAN